jgi:hypothetical protein
MVPLWAAVLGVIGTLAGVGMAQRATTKREANRDALRWAQERQQRELDTRTAAFKEALLALNKWYFALADLASHVGFPELRMPDLQAFPELEAQSEHSYVAIELFCSDEAADLTRDVLASLSALSLRLHDAGKEAEMNRSVDPGWRTTANLSTKHTRDLLKRLRDVYRSELTNVAAAPLR